MFKFVNFFLLINLLSEKIIMKKLLGILVSVLFLSTNTTMATEELSKIFYSGAKEKGKY